MTLSGADPDRSASRLRLALVAVGRVSALAAFVLGAAALRVVVSGEREVMASTEALRAGDALEAAKRARSAAGYYLPGAPHVRVAYERLAALATTAEGLGQRELALFCWRAIRTASLETRWLVTPHARDLERANEAIARLVAASKSSSPILREEGAALERRHLEALARDEAPRRPWIFAFVGSFFVWLAGAVWAVRSGVRPTGRVVLRRAAPGLLLAALGIALWVLSIWRA